MAGFVQGLPSIMNHSFSRVPGNQDLQRSSFDRSHSHKTTGDAGYLYPLFVDEAYPGDTYNLSASIVARLATPKFPIMDNLFLDTFWFFVPYRILWENWERFQGAQTDPADTIDYEVPYIDDGEPGAPPTFASGSLADYFGIPVGIAIPTDDAPVAFAFRAYNRIWNEWFRDENLQDSVANNIGDGPDDDSDYALLRRGKRHDYFTSCLPWPQKGDAISIPLGTSAPVIGDGTSIGFTAGVGNPNLYMGYSDNSGFQGTATVYTNSGAAGAAPTGGAGAGDAYMSLHTDPALSHVFADLSTATAATINQLREAFAFQQILETDARGGTRFVELLKAHWGVTVPDFRLQRPEYLGGSSQRIDIYGVAQTSSTDATTPQGSLAAYGQISAHSGFTKSIVEHGIIMCLVNLRADITYQQGMERFWSRRTRFDYYMPALAHLGEMPVYRKEIYMSAVTGDNNTVFGYQERWADLRYKPSRVSSLFRTAAAGSLDSWHLALNFTSAPSLNATFIVDAPDVDRVIAVTTEPHFIMDAYFKFRHSRALPIYSVPGLQRL